MCKSDASMPEVWGRLPICSALGWAEERACASHSSQTGRGRQIGSDLLLRLRQEVENSAGAFDRKRLHRGGEGMEPEKRKCPETSWGLDYCFS